MKKPTLNEGLRPLDLEEMVYPFFEVDTYCSKMGEDRDVSVLSFQVKDRSPANDLMEFIEKGYNFVLDSDISSGENEQGEYSVFVEIPRTPELPNQIAEVLIGVKKLTGLKEFSFKYHKVGETHRALHETFETAIPLTPQDYDSAMLHEQTESIKRFFNKTVMDDLTLDKDIITIHKPFGPPVQLRIIKEDTVEAILETTGTLTVDADSTAETFWLSKVLGDYNIDKLGDNFLFFNNEQAMLLQQVNK